LVLVAFLGAGVLASIPTTVLTSGWSEKSYVQLLLPESWQFFTRDPKTPAFVLYERHNRSAFARADTLPQTNPENAFGLSRNQRAQDTEKVLLAQGVSSWVQCGGSRSGACLLAAEKKTAVEVPGASGDPHFCGEFVLAEQETTRFNYREISDEALRVTQAVHIEVDC
jgi:antimicrobial peptide system SdpA family protein